MNRFLLCLNHNVFKPEYIKQHHPDVADVLYQWTKISALSVDSLHIVLTGASTAVVYYRNTEDVVCPVFVMTLDPNLPVEVLAEIMDGNSQLVNPHITIDNKKYTGVYCNDKYVDVVGYELLQQFMHDELVHKCRHTPQAEIKDQIKERLSNFGITLSVSTKLLDNKGHLVAVDKEQGFVVLNLCLYFLPEEAVSFLGPDMLPWSSRQIDMPVRYDFIISLIKNCIPNIDQWKPRLETTEEAVPQLRKETNMKSPLKSDKVTQTLLSGIEKLDVPEQLLKPVVVSHEVHNQTASQKVVALQNCLYTTKPEVTLETILDGIKTRYKAMEQPINVVYAYRVDLFTVKVFGGEGGALLTVVKSKNTDNTKITTTFKDENFFFEEEKQKIGHWLVDNYYGSY